MSKLNTTTKHMSENTLPNPGNYLARRSGPIVIGETSNKAIMAYIPYRILNNGAEGYEDVYAACLMAKDGTIQARNFEELHKVFPGWATNDPFELQDIAIPEGEEPEFALKNCYHEEYAPEGKESTMQFRVKWFNALNSDPRIPAPVTDDGRKAILARFGSKLKALGSLGGPAKKTTKTAPAPAPAAEVDDIPMDTPTPAPAAPAPAPAKKPGKPAAPAKVVRKSSDTEVFVGIQNKFADKSEEEHSTLYWNTQYELFPNKEKDADGQWVKELTPEEWGQVADKLGL
jgi:hypothetical protein